MINVQSLTKKIDGNTIVRDISFEVNRGEIMGFIGPNGAGKTTTLRMLSCAMAPTSGTAELAGFDLRTQDHEIRRILGYQPETPPLYPYMNVLDYLKFMADLRQIPSESKTKAIDSAIDKCKLAEMTGREIGKLSKGYRQRVGLAQAILASPKILLLDEPTASLDPEQINETRGIIRNCAEDAAVIFSTHIMQEIQHLCDRIVVIKQGQVRYKEHIRVTRATDNTRRHLVIQVRGNTDINECKIQDILADFTQSEHVNVDVRAGSGSAPHANPGETDVHILKLYAAIPDDDAMQFQLLQCLINDGIPILTVMPRESELEQTILHYMKN
ncbi:MAG: ABC transporter ATP-binding protein [Bacteroidetes bacterium]|nr:ABC transporter ATP-binding protein [Bacteroidota bacterium]MCH8524362.1 ABC transporter ATP-binding protein [Balneolales bacterium]